MNSMLHSFTSFSAVVLCCDSSSRSRISGIIVCIILVDLFLVCHSLANSYTTIPSSASLILRDEYQTWEIASDRIPSDLYEISGVD